MGIFPALHSESPPAAGLDEQFNNPQLFFLILPPLPFNDQHRSIVFLEPGGCVVFKQSAWNSSNPTCSCLSAEVRKAGAADFAIYHYLLPTSSPLAFSERAGAEV